MRNPCFRELKNLDSCHTVESSRVEVEINVSDSKVEFYARPCSLQVRGNSHVATRMVLNVRRHWVWSLASWRFLMWICNCRWSQVHFNCKRHSIFTIGYCYHIISTEGTWILYYSHKDKICYMGCWCRQIRGFRYKLFLCSTFTLERLVQVIFSTTPSWTSVLFTTSLLSGYLVSIHFLPVAGCSCFTWCVQFLWIALKCPLPFNAMHIAEGWLCPTNGTSHCPKKFYLIFTKLL